MIPSLACPDTSAPAEVARGRLVERVLARPESLVVIEAAAGTGKSTLLRQIARRSGALLHIGHEPPMPNAARTVLWDVPPGPRSAALPEAFVNGLGRIVIAKRGETVVPGLSRAMLYGRTARFRTPDLLLTREELVSDRGPAQADRVLHATGGWALLLAQNGGIPNDEDAFRNFLRDELLSPLPSADLVALKALMDGAGSVSDNDELMPFVQREADGRLSFAADAVRAPLAAAMEAELRRRLDVPADAKAIAEAFVERGSMPEAIAAYQGAGFHEMALRCFSEAHGRFFIYYYGSEAFDRVLAGFPSGFAMQSEVIVMSLAMQSCKRGDVALARRLLADRFGDAANDPEKVFSPRSVFSRDFRAFRVVMLIYEDFFFSDQLLEQLYSLLSEFPADAHLLRGSFHNSVLEYYMRCRRFAEAEDVAAQAHFHYDKAHTPILSFYISLHQAIMRLMMGDAVSARRNAAGARGYLDRAAFDSPNDRRLLDLLDACIEYEGGRAEPLARFLSLELDEFSHGEIWPSLIEFALQYGSQALSEHFSTIAARSFLDRWRIYQVRNRQFRSMIEIREAAVLQNGNRWQEAAERLTAVESRITRAWVVGQGDELSRLADRDELAMAQLWLRHIAFETPTRQGLEDLLAAMRNNLHITERQQIGIDVWLAYVHKRQRNLSKARAVLQKAFETVVRLGAIGALSEERPFLSDLIEDRRIGEFLDASPPARQILRKLRDTGLAARGALSAAGLSRRETKVLMMVAEGAANKFVAKTLGLSEATVKFHLRNVYRKLGCAKRREAISAARALGLVS